MGIGLHISIHNTYTEKNSYVYYRCIQCNTCRSMVCRSVSDRTLKLCEAWQELLPPLHLQIWFCTLWWSLQSKHFRVQVVNNFKLLGISEESHMLNFIWTHSYLYPSIYPSNPSLSIQFDRDVICMIPVSTSPSPKSSFLACRCLMEVLAVVGKPRETHIWILYTYVY